MYNVPASVIDYVRNVVKIDELYDYINITYFTHLVRTLTKGLLTVWVSYTEYDI